MKRKNNLRPIRFKIKGGEIRKARKAKGLTIADVSEMTNMGTGHLSQIENENIIRPAFDAIYRLAEALDQPVEAFVEKDETVK